MLYSIRHDVVRRLLAVLLGVLGVFGPSRLALAQSYGDGYAKYLRGDFNGAEHSLNAALKPNPEKGERAKILKLLGICQFMLGNRPGAQDSFRAALALKSDITIGASEVLDDGVIAFFNQQKSAKAAPAEKTAKASPEKGAKKTLLRVSSNAPGATVLMDGIIAGPAGEAINVDPGSVEVEVTANGFVSRKTKINILKDRENSVTVNLSKPQPKLVAAAAATTKKPAVKKPRAAKTRQKEDDIYAPVPDDNDLPALDAAAEFEREAHGYNQPQQYAQPNPYGQPGQVAYTQPNGQVAYAIIIPHDAGGGYQAPPPPPPPAEGGMDPYTPPPAYIPQDPAPLQDPAEPAARAGAHSKNNLLVTFLPFGAGQFQNDSYLLGGLFLGTEAYAIYYFVSKSSDVSSTTAARNKFVSEKKASGEDFSDKDTTYVSTTDEYIKNSKQQIQYAQLGFVGLWGIGVAQALVQERNAVPAKEKKTRKRKYGGFSAVVPDDVDVAPALNRGPGESFGDRWALNLAWRF